MADVHARNSAMSYAATLAVGSGTALGAVVRWGVTGLVSDGPGGWPWATLGVNAAGCLAIGCGAEIVGRLTDPERRQLLNQFLLTGACGGLTTFSAFAVQTNALGWAWGATYTTVSLVLCMAAVVGGRWAAAQLSGDRP